MTKHAQVAFSKLYPAIICKSDGFACKRSVRSLQGRCARRLPQQASLSSQSQPPPRSPPIIKHLNHLPISITAQASVSFPSRWVECWDGAYYIWRCGLIQEQVEITKTQQLMCHSNIPEPADFQASRIWKEIEYPDDRWKNCEFSVSIWIVECALPSTLDRSDIFAAAKNAKCAHLQCLNRPQASREHYQSRFRYQVSEWNKIPCTRKKWIPPCGRIRDSITCLFLHHMILRPTEVLESRTGHEDTHLVSMKDRKAINAAGSDHVSS